MQNNDGGPAFPMPAEKYADGQLIYPSRPGMSLRDWFAGQAISGILNNHKHWDNHMRAQLVRTAYEVADVMLTVRRT